MLRAHSLIRNIKVLPSTLTFLVADAGDFGVFVFMCVRICREPNLRFLVADVDDSGVRFSTWVRIDRSPNLRFLLSQEVTLETCVLSLV